MEGDRGLGHSHGCADGLRSAEPRLWEASRSPGARCRRVAHPQSEAWVEGTVTSGSGNRCHVPPADRLASQAGARQCGGFNCRAPQPPSSTRSGPRRLVRMLTHLCQDTFWFARCDGARRCRRSSLLPARLRGRSRPSRWAACHTVCPAFDRPQASISRVKNVRGDAVDRPFPFGGAPCAAAGLEGLRPRPRSTLLQGGSSVQKRERALRLGAATLVARQHGEHRSCFLEPPPNRGRGKSSIARSSPVHPLLNRWFTQSIHSIEASPDGSAGRQFRVRGGGWRAAAHFSSARAGQCGAAATRAGFFLP